jgi:hypothetical protein
MTRLFSPLDAASSTTEFNKKEDKCIVDFLVLKINHLALFVCLAKQRNNMKNV